jgi:membrane-associated phospholipid phosphatase
VNVSSTTGTATRALAAIIVAYLAAYLVAAAIGTYLIIYKSLLIPAFALYGLFEHDRARFLREWLPFLAMTVLFDAGRGASYALVEAGYRPVFVHYPIQLEELLIGVPAVSVPLQQAFQSLPLDRAMVIVHGSHFLYFLLFGLVVWHARREQFWRFRRSMIAVLVTGLVAYVLIPTAPPWMAAGQGLVPPINRTIEEIYTTYVGELYGAFDTNPVAAMPSIHVAFPAVCALVAWSCFSRTTAMLAGAYAILVCFAVMYLGDHYFVDVLAGVVLAGVAVGTVARAGAPATPMPLGSALLLGVAMVLASFGLAALAGY